MSFFELFTIIATSATIFAFILGLFSVYNGWMTRQEISKLIDKITKSKSRLTGADCKPKTRRPRKQKR